MTDVAIVALVHDYCPRLRTLPRHEVVPQALVHTDLPARPGELVLETGRSGARVESGLLGQPIRLARVIRRVPAGAWQLQVVCYNGGDRVPALELDSEQLRSALRADAGLGGLDLREAARRTARTVAGSAGGRVSLGTFSCRTGPQDLALEAGERFGCRLPLYSDQGQAVHRTTYAVHIGRPYLRPVP